jgi:1,2-diacylglycerol 3-alpha-glucosyltransferase
MTPAGALRVGMYTDTMLPRLDGIAISLEAVGSALQHLGVSIQVVAPRRRGAYKSRLPSRTIASFRPWGRDYNVGLVLPWWRSSRTSAGCYDIVHVHTLGPIGLAGLAAARHAGIPAILTWHTDVISYHPYYPEIRLDTLVAGITLKSLGVNPNTSLAKFNHRTILRRIFSVFDTIIVPTPKYCRMEVRAWWSCGVGLLVVVVESVKKPVEVGLGVAPVERGGGLLVAVLEGQQASLELGQVGEVVGR